MTEQVDNAQEAPAHEPSQNEIEARSAGWVPKDEYQGDENKWVDADEFVRRGPLFEKINSTTRELKEVRKALEQLKGHHSQVKETAFKEAIAALKKEKRDAYVDGDPDKIVEIDDKIDYVKAQQRQFEIQQAQEVQAAAQSVVHPDFQKWVDRNSWYNNSAPMKAFADTLGRELHAKGLSPGEVLQRVEAQVKEEFPQKFRNPNRDKAQAVEGSSSKGGRGKESFELDPAERQIMERFVRQGVMTREQYIADLKKIKEPK